MNSENKRYQVFISCTSDKSDDDHAEVVSTLLRMKCIPRDMRTFSANDSEDVSLIKQTIEDCDFHVLIIANPPSVEETLLRTEVECIYVLEKGIPTITFISESNNGYASQAVQLLGELMDMDVCEVYSSAHHLGEMINEKITELVEGNPKGGWVRADSLQANPTEDDLLDIEYEWYYQSEVTAGEEWGDGMVRISWKRLFEVLGGAMMMDRMNMDAWENPLSAYIFELESDQLLRSIPKASATEGTLSFSVSQNYLIQILTQLKAFGYLDLKGGKWFMTEKALDYFRGGATSA